MPSPYITIDTEVDIDVIDIIDNYGVSNILTLIGTEAIIEYFEEENVDLFPEAENKELFRRLLDDLETKAGWDLVEIRNLREVLHA